MELAQPVYDSWGDIVLASGTRLDARDIAQIDDIGVGELFIKTRHAEDIEVRTLVPPELEGAISKALRRVLIDCRTVLISRSQQMIDLALVNNLMDELLETVTGELRGDPSIAGCFSLRDYNYVHPVKVASLAVLMGKTIGMSHSDLKQLGMAALLQNIGYVLLPQGILEKPGFLNEAEIKALQRHPLYGSQILSKYTSIGPAAANAVLQHHERWNGSGYPFGLSGRDINISARILGITDVCFALASKRPHREEFLPSFAIEHSIVSSQDAIEYIIAYSGELFDPEMVRVFTRIVPMFPTGAMVKLNDGRVGIVSKSNPDCLQRPTIRIIADQVCEDDSTEIPDICSRCNLDCNQKHGGKKLGCDIDLSRTGKNDVLISELADY